MSKKVKKTLSLLAGFTAGSFFVMTVCLDAMLIIDVMHQQISFGAACLLLALSMALMLICMLFVIYFNRVFDEGEGIVQKTVFSGRWPMNVLFVSLAMTVLFIMVYAQEYQSSSLLRSPGRVSPLFFILAVVFSGFLYHRNYHRFLPRNRQVAKAEKTYAMKSRKFTFVVEEVLEDGSLLGTVEGEMRVRDSAYVLQGLENEGRMQISRIMYEGRKVRKASDCQAVVFLSSKNPVPVGQYMVLSNTRPGQSITPRIAAENPRIKGMISSYARHMSDSGFMSTMIYDVVHGHYLVAAKTDDESARSGDVTEAMRGSHSVYFQSVSTSREPDKSVFPVFTDWETLSRYENVMEDEKTVVMIMDFQQASEMLNKGYEGVVINPFGPASFFLSPEYIHTIKNLEGYRKEFILKEDAE